MTRGRPDRYEPLPSDIRWYKHRGAIVVDGARRLVVWGEDATGSSEGHAYFSRLSLGDAAKALARLRRLGDHGTILNRDVCHVDGDGTVLVKFGDHCLAGYLDDDDDLIVLTGFAHADDTLRLSDARRSALRQLCDNHRRLITSGSS